MSLIPQYIGDHNRYHPSRNINQHYGMGMDPEDPFSPIMQPFNNMCVLRSPRSYYKPWINEDAEQEIYSTVNSADDYHQINLDVQQFTPEEISVKITSENTVTVEGEHFVRRLILPEEYDMDKTESKLSSDGVLTITTPKLDAKQNGHRIIPILKTGRPSKTVKIRNYQ